MFFTCSWRFLKSNKLSNYNSNKKKLLGFRNMQEKLENVVMVTGLREIKMQQWSWSSHGFKSMV